MSTKATSRAPKLFAQSPPASRLSIDPDHHVTESIGDMYGEYTDEIGNRYSFIPSSPPGDMSRGTKRHSTLSVPVRGGGGGAQGSSHSQTPPPTPPPARSVNSSSMGGQAYPGNDIDYESDPVAVAQEMINLQALRRMSMDVSSAADPDLPSFNTFVPSTPPEDGGDPGSVFWVPARLHPELAPQEFSAYLEAKKNEIRRPQSGSLSPDGSNSGGPSLRRKKSMLSRQIDADSAKHYRDGAEWLERHNSERSDGSTSSIQLDDLMKDPTALMHKLSVDSQRREEGDQTDDIPIIFAPKVGLKRSTATHYRKGSMRRGERGSKRGAANRVVPTESGDFGLDKGFRLDRISTEPVSLPSSGEKEEGRQSQHGRRLPPEASPFMVNDKATPTTSGGASPPDRHKSAPPKARRSSSPKELTQTGLAGHSPPPVPTIVEIPPPPTVERPERHSSFDAPSMTSTPPKKQHTTHHHSSDVTPDATIAAASAKTEHMTVPDQRGSKKRPESSGSTGSTNKDRKTSWGWLLGDSDKGKDKEEQKERERDDRVKSKREKRPKSTEKPEKYDNTRLDVLQKSIELGGAGGTGKVVAASPDPVVAPPVVVEPPPRTDSRESRRSRGEDRKEKDKDKDKDSGFLSFFGGSRKKSGEHSSPAAATPEKKGRSSSSRGTSPDPAPQPKYYYTRFPIHIERAIYRLSHLKLANPRRPLHQQVLLSNFMYAYLALVQQTQPHLVQQATSSPSQQQKQEAAERQRQQEQQRWQQRQEEQQLYEQQQQQLYYDDAGSENGTDYVDDSQGEYNDSGSGYSGRQGENGNAEYYEHQQQQRSRGRERENGDAGGGGGKHGRGRDERDDMW